MMPVALVTQTGAAACAAPAPGAAPHVYEAGERAAPKDKQHPRARLRPAPHPGGGAGSRLVAAAEDAAQRRFHLAQKGDEAAIVDPHQTKTAVSGHLLEAVLDKEVGAEEPARVAAIVTIRPTCDGEHLVDPPAAQLVERLADELLGHPAGRVLIRVEAEQERRGGGQRGEGQLPEPGE